MLGKMESRVIVLEEKLIEVGEKQSGLESKVESGFSEASCKFNSLNHQMQLILSRLDAMNAGVHQASTSSEGW